MRYLLVGLIAPVTLWAFDQECCNGRYYREVVHSLHQIELHHGF
jgi:hypothetical protein